MKKIFIILIAFLTISFSSHGQDTIQLKRIPYKLTVAVDKSSFYEEEIKATPYVLPDKTVQLYPGETIYIEFEQDNGVIKSLTAVKAIKDLSKTLTLSFSQSAKKKVHELMMLKVTNPFPYRLIYKASIYLFVQKKWVNTDVLPIEPRLSGFETWPNIISTIGLGGWSLEAK